MLTITYTVRNDTKEYTDIFSKKYPLNSIVESLQRKHIGEYGEYPNIYLISIK